MTIGIYSLYWETQDLIYIGQSQDIDRRFTEHLYKLKNNKHTNYKVQNTYNLYGPPKLVIIHECTIEELNAENSCAVVCPRTEYPNVIKFAKMWRPAYTSAGASIEA